MNKENLLKTRIKIKSRKPTFKRFQSHQFAKLRKDDKWRMPKGMGNKVRRNRRGKPSMPTVGFGSPKAVRGLNRLGFVEVIVSNVADLAKVNQKEDTVVIASSVGKKKRLAILNEAKKLKLNVSNIKDIDTKIKSLTKVKKVETKTKSETLKKEEKIEVNEK